MRRFPPGGANDKIPFGTHATGAGWGSSWLVYILPFVEQGNVFDQMQFAGGATGGSGYNHPVNTLAIKGLVIKGYNCPSSPLKITATSPVPTTSGPMQAPSYVAISGAIDGLIPNYSETRTRTGTYGIASGGGVLVPNGQTRMADITDGTSNTAMISEYSNFLQQGTTLAKVDWRMQGVYGFLIGLNTAIEVGPSFPADAAMRTGGMVTVRYPVNQIKGSAGTGWSGTVATDGVGAQGVNLPLNSAHPSGVIVGLADGSVRFLSQSTPLPQLAGFVTRDDGQTLALD